MSIKVKFLGIISNKVFIISNGVDTLLQLVACISEMILSVN